MFLSRQTTAVELKCRSGFIFKCLWTDLFLIIGEMVSEGQFHLVARNSQLYSESRDVTWNDNHWKGPLLFVVTGSVRTCILFYIIKITHEKMSISRPELVCSLHVRRYILKDFLSTHCYPYLMLFPRKMKNVAAFKICF